jgi:hypothetical protein
MQTAASPQAAPGCVARYFKVPPMAYTAAKLYHHVFRKQATKNVFPTGMRPEAGFFLVRGELRPPVLDLAGR